MCFFYRDSQKASGVMSYIVFQHNPASSWEVLKALV